ncbi:MAG: hypothetical protein AAGB26_12120 [Planctomycetota bacterium]
MSDEKIFAEKEDLAMVLLGDFNPPILAPHWLFSTGLTSKSEADEAKVDVIHPEFSNFQLSWAAIACDKTRLQIETSDIAKEFELRDMVFGIITVLEHIPLRAFGFNYSVHVKFNDIEVWHRFGHDCTPKAIWSDYLEKPGMRSLVIEGKRQGATSKRTQIKVEPSPEIETGVHIHINEHFVLDNEKTESEKRKEIETAGSSEYPEFLKHSKYVVQNLLENYFKE